MADEPLIITPPADPPPADPPAPPADPPPADPPADPPSDPDFLIKPPGTEEPLAPPAEIGLGYDWEGDPLQLGNVPLSKADTQYLLAGKYKGANLKEGVQNLEKGYVELSKLLRSKGYVAPETYSFEAEGLKSLNAETQAEMTALAKEIGMTQAQFEKWAPSVQEFANELATTSQTNLLADAWQVKAGTPEFLERQGKVERWVAEAVQNGLFTADQIFGPQGLARTAGGIQALEAIRDSGGEKGFWAGGEKTPTGMSMDQARAYLNDTKGPYHVPTHPDHARVKTLVDNAYRSQPGAAKVILG